MDVQKPGEYFSELCENVKNSQTLMVFNHKDTLKNDTVKACRNIVEG